MKKLILIVLSLLPCLSFSSVCHPDINPRMSQYLVAYGSLIDQGSRTRTEPTAVAAYPILIKGYKRSWSAHGNLPGVNASFLAVTKNSKASFNGIIFKLNKPSAIQLYDKRETIYCRRELKQDDILTYVSKLPKDKQIWIYISEQKEALWPNDN